jgi:hypothetical protein
MRSWEIFAVLGNWTIGPEQLPDLPIGIDRLLMLLNRCMSQLRWENLASLLSVTTAIVAALGLMCGLVPERRLLAIDTAIRRSARRVLAWFIFVPIFSIAINVGIAVHHRQWPTPKIHDEFSYLLAGDTFAHGRLANPTPPFAEHFETPQELMQPTRMSKYPPGQGLFLALGQVIGSEPILGVWISTALACLAIYWMLLAFVRLPWALLGGLLACVHPQLLDWSQVYWGGSVAVLGGALILGAWARLMRVSSITHAIWLGIGILILANTRPYEGLMLCAPLLIALIVARHRHLRTWIPMLAILLVGLLWMGYYNQRVTGHALRMPFAEYAAQYDVYPKFWFLPRRSTPVYRNPSQLWVHAVFEKGSYEQLRTLPGLIRISLLRTWQWLGSNLKLAVLAFPLALGICTARNREIRWVLASGGVFLIGLWAESFLLPHYTAPAMGLILLLLIIGWERLWQWGRVGRHLSRAILLGWIIGALMSACQPISEDSKIINQHALIDRPDSPLSTGRHLVFVRYEPGYLFDNEFVYNGAELESGRIIWARYFGPPNDEPVAQHFGNRQLWLLDAGERLNLQPYPGLRNASP